MLGRFVTTIRRG